MPRPLLYPEGLAKSARSPAIRMYAELCASDSASIRFSVCSSWSTRGPQRCKLSGSVYSSGSQTSTTAAMPSGRLSP
jgi:hypothetical protein